MSLNTKTSNILKSLRKAAIYILVVLLLIVLGRISYGFGREVFSDEGKEKKPGIDITVTIGEGDSTKDVAQALYDNGVIGDVKVFYVQSLIYDAKFKPGTYTINNSANGEEIIAVLSAEKSTEEKQD